MYRQINFQNNYRHLSIIRLLNETITKVCAAFVSVNSNCFAPNPCTQQQTPTRAGVRRKTSTRFIKHNAAGISHEVYQTLQSGTSLELRSIVTANVPFLDPWS